MTETYSLQQLDKINIVSEDGKMTFGPDQEWYPEERARISGCGPTSGALITAYLARTRPEKYGALYREATFGKADFVRHMQTLFRYLLPGPMGLNSLGLYREGMEAYLKSIGVLMTPLMFPVHGIDYFERNRAEELCAFVRDALAEDQPIAFLALSRGKETALQNWHWITIVSAEISDEGLYATASDEGIARRFDLMNWYRTTRLSGGLIRLRG